MYGIATILLISITCGMIHGNMTPEQRVKFFNFQNECMQETGATDDMVLKAFAGELTDSPVFKNHLVCVGMKGGVMDDAGNLNRDVMKKGIMMFVEDEVKVDAMMDKCDMHYDTKQDTAFNMMKCMFKEHFGA
uniref:Odorant binding protein OBP1768 n=1 Tax=Rhynchophorus palmarum TaxID=93128 RepID=A0A8A5RE32_9CUCU|nr:odorant binding protein OBP1768 [Rhynchophorus palmarum]